jgi:hypothetical protein
MAKGGKSKQWPNMVNWRNLSENYAISAVIFKNAVPAKIAGTKHGDVHIL